MNILELSEQEILRRQSLDELRRMGINPYPAAEYTTNAFSTDILAEFSDDAPAREVSIAGRMMSRRVMGKASFVELQDSKGRIQVYVTRDDLQVPPTAPEGATIAAKTGQQGNEAPSGAVEGAYYNVIFKNNYFSIFISNFRYTRNYRRSKTFIFFRFNY